MKIRAKIKKVGSPDSEGWEEWLDKYRGLTYQQWAEEDESMTPRKFVEQIVERFNDTIRPGEKPRELISFRIDEEKE